MKGKIKLLSKTLLFLFVAFFVSNVKAFDYGSAMTNEVFEPDKKDYVYVSPAYASLQEQHLPSDTIEKSEGFELYEIDTGDDQNRVMGTGLKIAAIHSEDPNAPDYNTTGVYHFTFDNKYVIFKNFYTIDGQDIDVKVTLISLDSNRNKNEIRIYSNEKRKGNVLQHRYLGFGTFNKDYNDTNKPEQDFYDLLRVKVQLFKSGTNQTEEYKNDKLILYYNDIDALQASTPELSEHELAKFYNINSANIFKASKNSKLKINNDGIISSTELDDENGGWYTEPTKKLSLVVKGNTPLQKNGTIELGFGHNIGQDIFGYNTEGRFGQTDIQFLVPQTIEGSKTYSEDTTAGDEGEMVRVDDVIKYKVTLNPKTTSTDTVIVKVKDTLSKGLKYVEGSASTTPESVTENKDGTTTIIWELEIKKQTSFTYSAKVVNGYVSSKVYNNAVAIIGNEQKVLGKLVNPLPSKKYAEDTPNGLDGAKVEKGNVIKYSITYKNTTGSKEKVRITDTLSKGLKYKKGSAMIGKDAVEPKVIENEDGTTTLVWERELSVSIAEEITYSADVTGGVSEVKNNAYIEYAKIKAGSTTEYEDYSNKTKLNELVNPLDVIVPDTGINTSSILIIFGVMLIATGLVVIKKNTKKSLK